MRDLKPPFKFDFRKLLMDAIREFHTRVGSISIKLPFVSFCLNPTDLETRIAREIVIRMADRRVLTAFECCDNCIDQALKSLQEIRRLLVDKQVELSCISDSPLHLLILVQVEAIRQFMTFVQKLNELKNSESQVDGIKRKFGMKPPIREKYFAALEMMRAHLHRCLTQVAKIGKTEIPNISNHMRYDEIWQLDAYEEIKENT